MFAIIGVMSGSMFMLVAVVERYTMLDARTIALLIALISALQVIIITLCYFTAARYPGLKWWIVSGILNTLGWLLLLLRDILPDMLTIVVSNTCLMFATLLLYYGLNRFLGVRRVVQERLSLIITLMCSLSFLFLTYQIPSIAARTIVISAVVALIASFCAWNLWRTPLTHLRISARFAAGVLTVYSLWYMWRVIFTLVSPALTALFSPTPVQIATFLVTLAGIILWNASFVIMVIQRLHADLIAAQVAERSGLEAAYQQVRAREQLFRQTFEQSPIGAALITLDQRFARLNDVLGGLLGYDEADVRNTDVAHIIHPDERASSAAQLQSLADGRIPHLALEQRWCRRNGETLWVQVSARLVQQDPDVAPAVFIQAIDITARKLMEETLREREVMLDAISDNLPDAVVYQLKRTVAGDEQFMYLGRTSKQLSKVAPDQAYRDPAVRDTLHDSQGLTGYQAALEHSYQTLEVLDYEMQTYLPNGKLRWSSLRSRPRRLADGSTVWDGIEIDITEQKQAEAHLHQRIDELVSLNWITQVLADWTNLPESLKSVASEIQTLFEAVVVAIWIYEGPDTLRRLVSINAIGTRTTPDTLPLSTSPLAQRLRTQETVLLLHEIEDPLIAIEDASRMRPQSIFLVPLVTHGEALGLLKIRARQPDRVYTPADVALAQTIAAPLAIAIENARLFTQVQTSAAEAERRRLGRELHDSVSQALFAAHRAAEVLPQLWELDPEEGLDGLREIRHLTHSALAEMRALLLELRPQVLRDMPLHGALHDLLQGLAAHHAIHVDELLDPVPLLPPDVQLALYRIAQESLNNVTKHARAQRVTVRLTAQPVAAEQWQGEITLSVDDDGDGFDPAHIPTGRIGLTSLRERAAEIAATLAIVSTDGTGTHVTITWRGAAADVCKPE